MNSFDLFDTLVARRCVWPFTDRRDPQPEREWDELFPVAENVARVRPGDLVVSDMYLPREFLERVLREKCGLGNEVVVSEDGKATGAIWKKLKSEERLPSRHHGDHPILDVQLPRVYGVETEHVARCAPTAAEMVMLNRGATAALGQAMREARLRTWHADPATRALQLCQSQANFPMLALASVGLHRFAAGRKVLVSGRDGCLWFKLLPRLTSSPAEYFRSSRVARRRASRNYLEYVLGVMYPAPPENTVLADLCGTGWSLRLLCDALPGAASWLFSRYCGDADKASLLRDYEAVRKPASALGGHMVEVPSEQLEAANYDLELMTVDADELLRPKHADGRGWHDWELTKRIFAGHAAFHACLDAFDANPRSARLHELPQDQLAALAADRCRALGEWHSELSFADGAKREEERWIMRQLSGG